MLASFLRRNMFMKYRLLLLIFFIPVFCFGKDPAAVWDLSKLNQPPRAKWGPVVEKVVVNDNGEKINIETQKVWYDGELYNGHPTTVFAFFSRPKGAGPFPGMVLVHGGGGTAYSVWPELWAARGYAAIAMDLSGVEIIPDISREGDKEVRRPLEQGGPPQDDGAKFSDFDVEKKEYRNRWPWQSIASIMRAHSLLDSLPCVDPNRTGATGISWGGYLTSMLSGVDSRFQVIVPVYGCGYLERLSAWSKRMAAMTPEHRKKWTEWSDPASWLPNAKCRMLFVDGTDDFAYPLDIHRACQELVPGSDVRLQVAMPHSHNSGWRPKEIAAYVDSVLKGAEPLPCLDKLNVAKKGDVVSLSAKVKYNAKPVEATLYYTTDPGGFDPSHKWQIRKWSNVPAVISNGTITGTLPKTVVARPVRVFLEAKDARGLTATTHFEEVK